MDIIDAILSERPNFHFGETEVNEFDTTESFLPPKFAELLASHQPLGLGIENEAAHFISRTLQPNSQTLETGAGISTLIFAIKGAHHTAITPNEQEVIAIQQYAETKNISLDHVKFVIRPSESYLPGSYEDNLDMVFIDGKHAFPWPIVDWFYTADRLKLGGLMIIDDAQIKAVQVLIRFLKDDPGWHIQWSSGRTQAFQKVRPLIRDTAWHMQPFNMPLSLKYKKIILDIYKRLLK